MHYSFTANVGEVNAKICLVGERADVDFSAFPSDEQACDRVEALLTALVPGHWFITCEGDSLPSLTYRRECWSALQARLARVALPVPPPVMSNAAYF